MKTFYECSGIFRAVAGSACLLLCVTAACNLVLSWKQGKKLITLGAVFFELCCAALLQTCRFVADARLTGVTVPEILLHRRFVAWAALPAQWPGAAWVAVLSILMAYGAWLSWINGNWRRTHVTPLSIQESFERLTEGLCYYRTGGQCVLVNGRMHEICKELTGHVLLNGEEFEEEIRGSMGNDDPELPGEGRDGSEAAIRTLPNGSTVAFTASEVTYHGETLRELIATDVTEIHAKTERLRRENERLKRFQAELLSYNAAIQETVRREEILRAKMSIHDEMNRLLLLSRTVSQSGNEGEREKVLLTWKSNAILLCKETEGAEDAGGKMANAIRDMETIARSLGMELIHVGKPERAPEEVARLFVLATREALNNAAKHARARHLFVAFEEGENSLAIEYRNDLGTMSENRNGKALNGTVDDLRSERGGEAGETGGLKNLREKVEQAGGRMEVCFQPEFVIRLDLKYEMNE